MKKKVKEASMVPAIAGFELPIGAKGKKKNNVSKPYGETIIYQEMADESMKVIERVESSGTGEWMVVDPRTGAKHGPYADRDSARKAQRDLGISVPRNKDSSSEPPGSKPQKSNKPVKFRKPRVTRNVESLKRMIKKTLGEAGVKASVIKESSVISYIFKEGKKSSLWEGVLSRLPREAVLEDKGLSEVLHSIAQAEARTLAKSVVEIKKVLEGVGPFMVERKEADQDPDSGEIRMPFVVKIGEGNEMLFAVKLEEGKPLVLFPEESRKKLNSMLTKESKLLRAELMHVQETVLDKINDVVEASMQRDSYLSEMHQRLSSMVEGLNFVESTILKGLVREKLKGVKR